MENNQKTESREDLVKQIRTDHAKRYKPDFIEGEEQVTPCCETCEFFSAERKSCIARGTAQETTKDGLCDMWGASYDAFCEGLSKAKRNKAKRK